jgi:NAD(P)-dependent dehydrogenase (short-subunit alcohol dehydrogenase family)
VTGPAPLVCVVIGASSGIGLSTARELARRGEHLFLAARSEARLQTVAAQCRAEGAAAATVVVTDVGDEASVDALFTEVKAQHGRVDVVVHTATVMAYGTVEQVPSAIFTTVVDTAVNGTFFTARAALRMFRPQGRGTLVVVNSLLGSIAAPEMGAYATSKWGQAALIRTLQLETRNERNIRICSISPGGVNTPIYSQAANYTGRTAQPPPPIDAPEKVAATVVRCIDHPRSRVSLGIANPLIVTGFRILPQIYDALVTPLLHLASLTRKPTEPSTGNVLEPVAQGESEHGPWTGRWQFPSR